MLGSWFYNERVRKAVAVFGSLFNNLYVVRKNGSGETISQVKVPLSYAPKRDFLSRMRATEAGEDQERQIAIKLPRMSFEIVAFQYDATRQLPKINSRVVPNVSGAATAQRIYTPVPFNLQFQLNVYARSHDDALQIVEQILPYFTPQYTVSVKPLEDFDLQEDTPIRLDGVVFSDDYEGAIETRRTIVYTLDFEMKINLYKKTDSPSSTILQTETSLYDFDTGGLLSYIQCNANVVSGNTGTLANEDGGSIVETIKIENTLNELYRDSADNIGVINEVVIGSPFSISAGDSAEYGTSTIVPNTGTWTYTPNPDYYGPDSFKVSVDVGQNVIEKFTVNVSTTTPEQDVFNDAFTVYNNVPTLINVATNDQFETTGDITHVVETTSAGFVVIEDTLNGIFKYTADTGFTGIETWEYRAIPTGGQAEVATVTMTVTGGLTYSVSVPNAIEGSTVQATITTNYANNQTVNWSITGDNNTNGRISTTSGSVTMDALSKTVDIVVGQPAGEQGTATSTFTISDAGTDHDAPYDNPFATAVTASDTFDILDTYPPETYQAPTPTNGGDFSYSLDTTDTYAVIGEPGNNKAYLRTIADGTTIELVPSGGNQTQYFGRKVAIDGNQILVSSLNGSNGQASVYLFDTSGTVLNVWDQATNTRFGFELFFTTNYIGIAEPRAGSANGGIIYFYDRSSPYTLLYTKDYGPATNNYVGTSVAVSPSTDDLIAGIPGRASAGRLIKISGGSLQFNNFLDTHDNTAGIWDSHYDDSNSFTNGPTSVAMSNNHIFLGVPKRNRVSVWRYADPLNGNFGSLGATPTTPRIDGSFSVTNSGTRINLGAQAPDLIAGRTDPNNMAVGEYDGFLWRQGTLTWYGANGGIAWIRNKDTDEYIITRVSRDMQAFGFPATPQYPTHINTRTVNWTTDGSEPGSSPAVPGYTTDGTYNLQISMIVQFSHVITITGQSGETDIDFGRYVKVSPDNTELYVAAPLESWSGENRGTIYRFALDDTVDVGFDRTLASDTIATLNGYLRGEIGDRLGFGVSASSYFYGQVTDGTYSNGNPSSISTNGTFVLVSNNEFSNNQGRVLENQVFTSI